VRASQAVNTNGIVLFEGPSNIDGAPIVVIATGLETPSANRKTGPMVQTWILRSDVSPVAASRSALDESVCGTCPLRWSVARGTDSPLCYVNIGQAPLGIYRAYVSGSYARASVDVLTGRAVRFGAYGDPAAAPLSLWKSIARVASMHTGYTHQWRRFPEYLDVLMASVESERDASYVRSVGARSFRTIADNGTPAKGLEISCPASVEANNRSRCIDCKLCDGKRDGNVRSITIRIH